MNLNCNICIIAYKAIIEHVALLYCGILLFRAQGLHWKFHELYEIRHTFAYYAYLDNL